MRKFLLALCAVAALGIGFMPEAPASEYDGEKVVTRHHGWGGGWHRGGRGGWGGGRGGYGGGGCW